MLAARLLRRPRAWLEAEHTSLVAGVGLAARFGLDQHACDLASALVQASFRINNQFDEWWRTHDTALTAARHAGNPRAEAVILTGLGQLRHKQDRFADANRYFRESLAIFRRLPDVAGQATASSTSATRCRRTGPSAAGAARP